MIGLEVCKEGVSKYYSQGLLLFLVSSCWPSFTSPTESSWMCIKENACRTVRKSHMSTAGRAWPCFAYLPRWGISPWTFRCLFMLSPWPTNAIASSSRRWDETSRETCFAHREGKPGGNDYRGSSAAQGVCSYGVCYVCLLTLPELSWVSVDFWCHSHHICWKRFNRACLGLCSSKIVFLASFSQHRLLASNVRQPT